MKRSEINRYLAEAKDFFRNQNFNLPPWADWSPEDWDRAGPECDEIRDCCLGWDITDFGKGEFEKTGLLLFTIRNGNYADPGYEKTYAEKIMISRDAQVTPAHFHWSKMEDIINRGGGDFVTQVWMADDEEGLSNSNFSVRIDGVERNVSPGTTLRLKPGESISFQPRCYHAFRAENGMCMIGEVSMVNDDARDNRFLDPVGRFPEIEEDEVPLHLLCNEYPRARIAESSL